MVAWTEAVRVGKDELTERKDVRGPHLPAFLTDRCQMEREEAAPDKAPALGWGHPPRYAGMG